MGHYNSRHAVLEEKNHDFEIALLQVRNVKQSSYFRWQWEPELFLASQPSLQAMKAKEICAVRSLQGPAWGHWCLCFTKGSVAKSCFTTECKISRLEHTFLLQSLPQMTQWAITCSVFFQRASQAHKTTALLKHHKQKQHSSNKMVSQLCIIFLKIWRLWFDAFCYKSQLPTEEGKISVSQ